MKHQIISGKSAKPNEIHLGISLENDSLKFFRRKIGRKGNFSFNVIETVAKVAVNSIAEVFNVKILRKKRQIKLN